MTKRLTYIFLCLLILVSVFIHYYKNTQIPGCVNADEAAFGYNSFSILKTGYDEHGKFLPLRLMSFNDFKLPLYSYLSMPFIGLMGLNDVSIRLLNKVLGVLFIPLIYVFTYELFKKRNVAIISSFIVTFSPWIYILSRHAHEAVLCSFFALLTLIFLVKFQNRPLYKYLVLAGLCILLSTFAYHTGRVYLVISSLYACYILYQHRSSKMFKNRKLWIAGILLLMLIPFTVDFLYGAHRVESLLFFKTAGFQQKLDEYLREDPNRLLHNKLTASIQDVSMRYISQLSPDFLVRTGDNNPRFGYEGIGLITPIEYLFFVIGFYFLFWRKQKYRWILLLFLIVTPIANALTWLNPSLSRTYFLICIIAPVCAYGMNELFSKMSFKKGLFMVFCIFFYCFYLVSSWDIYFNHYFKRAYVTRSWQCGYEDLVHYVKNSYPTTKHFYITSRYGQPYIFFLMYLGYDPVKYNTEAKISQPDEYGFTKVLSFDKFTFFQDMPKIPGKDTIVIGFPDEFNDRKLNHEKIEKIKYGTEEIFLMYRN